VELLDPDPAQHLGGGQVAEPARRGGCREGREQMMAVLADLLNPGGPLGGRARQAVIEGAPFVGLRPVRQDLRQQPLGRRQGEHLQGMPQRLVDALDPAHRPGGGQDVRGVRALSSSGLEQPMRGGDLQNRVQQQGLRRARDQARAELAQHRAVEAGVGERQPEQVFPIYPAPHRIRRLPVGQVFRELQQDHQGQAPWRLCGLTLGWEEMSEATIV
jgi:hypothetical protein